MLHVHVQVIDPIATAAGNERDIDPLLFKIIKVHCSKIEREEVDSTN